MTKQRFFIKNPNAGTEHLVVAESPDLAVEQHRKLNKENSQALLSIFDFNKAFLKMSKPA